jgi:putative SbcD/Mre11-related phosphoesterase
VSVTATSCHPHEGWLLTPEAAAIRPERATAVVADLHLGYEWARGDAGDCVPAHSLAETLDRLDRLLGRADLRTLVVAGDLVESARPCARTAADVHRLTDWLRARGVELVVVPGNHDRGFLQLQSRARRSRTASAGPVIADAELNIDGWTVCHGHQPTSADRVVMGHHHPVLAVDRTAAPCFLAGPRLLVLPAFSRNAAGYDVGSRTGTRPWPNQDQDQGRGLRCVAVAGSELLDFGPVETLATRIGASRVSDALIPNPR